MSLERDLLTQALPAYTIGDELGRGGCGLVLRGRHRALGREVAIKQLPRAFAADASVRRRFADEARVLAGFAHPHIVTVFDYVEAGPTCVLVMELLAAGSLWDRFQRDGLTHATSVAVLLASLGALQYAHAAGVLHRDVKPENILFAADGTPKVTDFGIAKMLTGGRTVATRAGEVLGTPAYMAPEQVTGADLGPPCDVYAAGTVLYELLAGRLPYADDAEPIAVLYRHVHERPAPLRSVAPVVPSPIAEVVDRAVEPDVGSRFASAEEFGVALVGAAARAWGEGWGDQVTVPVLAAPGRTTLGRSGPHPVSPDERQHPVNAGERPEPAGGAGPPRPATVVDGGAPLPPPVPVKVPPVPPLAARPVAPPAVRPAEQARVAGVAAADVAPADLVPVATAVAPRRAGGWALVAGAAAVLCAMAALVGPGAPARGGSLEATVNGHAVASGAEVPIDLGRPIEVVVPAPQGVGGRARIRFTALGVPLGPSAAADLVATPGEGTATASLDATGSRLLVPGPVSATLEVRRAGAVESVRFGVRPDPRRWATVPAGVALVVALVVVSYAESFARPLRRARKGRRAGPAIAGFALVGGAGGAAAVLVAWVCGGDEPTPEAVGVCAVAGLAAGLSGGVALARWGRARRLRRAVAR